MNKQLQQVAEFHKVFNVFTQNKPQKLNDNVRQLRETIMSEELLEVNEAMADEPIENIAKELADLIYVAYGTVLAYGLQDKFDEIFDEVHRSNMSKLDKDGRVVLRNDGKVLKSDLYKEADIKSILEK